MAEKAKHAFGALERVDEAIAAGKIDAYDILFVKDANGKPYVGWVDKDGNKVVVDDSAEIAELEASIATKANAEEVEEKLGKVATDTVATAKAYTDGKVEAAISEHMTKKYEIADVPVGTLVDYREDEIRVMCPVDAEYHLQGVGTNGNPNTYYMTFKTYVPNDDVVGYREYINGAFDTETLTDIKTDGYGRRYQPTWLSVADYNADDNSWTYRGAKSTNGGYVGWDYRIDWYNADDVIIASDRIRINLSNENCHSSIEPYYVGSMMKEVDEKINTKIEEIQTGYEIVEF